MKGKIIVIEGTDCSGKETQTNLLVNILKERNIPFFKTSFPVYDTPTGKIIAGPFLGKKIISSTYFDELPQNVEPKVASLYYAADRLYNIKPIEEAINEGKIVILDRYVGSNMAHQGCKLNSKEKRIEMYNWLEKLEYEFLNLPKPDVTLFLYMPYEKSLELKLNREEALDEVEKDKEHLIKAERTYKELAQMYNYYTIDCVEENQVKSIEQIHKDIVDTIIKNNIIEGLI